MLRRPTNEISDTEIAEILSTKPDPQHVADQLIQSALSNQGLDNVTAIVEMLQEKETFPIFNLSSDPTQKKRANHQRDDDW